MERTCLPLCTDPEPEGAEPVNASWDREAGPELPLGVRKSEASKPDSLTQTGTTASQKAEWPGHRREH